MINWIWNNIQGDIEMSMCVCARACSMCACASVCVSDLSQIASFSWFQGAHLLTSGSVPTPLTHLSLLYTLTRIETWEDSEVFLREPGFILHWPNSVDTDISKGKASWLTERSLCLSIQTSFLPESLISFRTHLLSLSLFDLKSHLNQFDGSHSCW